MHRDVKIGLILSVLLVGLVAALFFRREPQQQSPGALAQPERSSESPPLVQLDPPKTLEQDTTSPEPQPADASTGEPAAPTNPNTNAAMPGRVPAALHEHTHAVGGAPHLPMRSETDGTGGAVSPPLRPEENRTTPPVTPLRRHRVDSGDTLWELAERYLGDGARADEIFQANRNILTSPQLLPLGKELVIPHRAGRTALAPHQASLAPTGTLALNRPAPPATNGSPAGLQAPPAVVRSVPGTGTAAPRSGTNRTTATHRSAGRYTVRDGDTLHAIARKIYHDQSRWLDIYNANRRLLANPNQVRPGMVLTLPVR